MQRFLPEFNVISWKFANLNFWLYQNYTRRKRKRVPSEIFRAYLHDQQDLKTYLTDRDNFNHPPPIISIGDGNNNNNNNYNIYYINNTVINIKIKIKQLSLIQFSTSTGNNGGGVPAAINRGEEEIDAALKALLVSDGDNNR